MFQLKKSQVIRVSILFSVPEQVLSYLKGLMTKVDNLFTSYSKTNPMLDETTFWNNNELLLILEAFWEHLLLTLTILNSWSGQGIFIQVITINKKANQSLNNWLFIYTFNQTRRLLGERTSQYYIVFVLEYIIKTISGVSFRMCIGNKNAKSILLFCARK